MVDNSIANYNMEKQIEGRPIFLNNCMRCGACTQNCPQNSMRFEGEKSRARYRNEHVTLKEIVAANSEGYTPNIIISYNTK